MASGQGAQGGARDDSILARVVDLFLGGRLPPLITLLSLVAAYQAVTDWHRRRPADGVPGGRGESGTHRLDALDVLENCQ